MFKVADPNSSIYVELTTSGAVQVFEFPPAEERAIVVGSIEWANVRVMDAAVAPVQFHLEREDAAIWLIPAYGVADLSVNAVSVRGPTALAQRSVIEFCGVRVYAAIREADPLSVDDDRFATHDPNALRDRESYSLRLPGEADSTVLAMRPVRPSAAPAGDVTATERTIRQEHVQEALPLDNNTLQLAPFRAVPTLADGSHPILTSRGTEIMAPYRPPASAAIAMEDIGPTVYREPFPTAQISPDTEVTPKRYLAVAESISPDASESPTAIPDSEAEEQAWFNRGEPRESRYPVPSLPVVPLLTPKGLLSAIGLLTRARPLLVLGGASIGALVLFLTLLGAAQLIEQRRATPAPRASLGALIGVGSTVRSETSAHDKERADAQRAK